METLLDSDIRVGTLDELNERGCMVVCGGGRTIAVFSHNGQVHAVDSRCPHMGFPLQKGTVKDGILTCHWHHARFDLCSGGTFDAFADDVSVFPLKVVEGEVWVNPRPGPRDEIGQWGVRLQEGLEHSIRLVIAKSVLGLQAGNADYRVPLRIGARFGASGSAEGWGPALSILTCVANLLPHLAGENRPRALYQGLLHLARECAGKPPRFPVKPLPTKERRPEVYTRWFRNFIDVRDEEGAERCLRTAIELGVPSEDIAQMIFAAATDHLYLDGGHVLDFANKAFELLDHIGWEHAGPLLTSLVHGMASARRSEELNSWRYPVDLAALVWQARAQLPAACDTGRGKGQQGNPEIELATLMLESEPAVILDALIEAIRDGATPEALGSTVAYAAFLRLARFHTANEFGDWDTVHNTVTAAHALHQALKRVPSAELLRAVFDTAMSIHLDRFLNLPEQRLPEPALGPVDANALRAEILDGMNVQQQVEETAERVSRYLTAGADPDPLLATLGHAMLREDAGFHAYQIVDAAFQQYRDRRSSEPGRHILIGMARFLAAHSPTSRAVDQTYRIAWRLQRGEEIHRGGAPVE
jgi:nitrite reductase/ring-hydroxylating ferredoxin subunit